MKIIATSAFVISGLAAAIASPANANCARGPFVISVLSNGRPTVLSDLPAGDPFRRFAEQLVPELETRFAAPDDRKAATSETPRLELRFLRQGLATPAANEMLGSSPPAKLRLDSPWAKIRQVDGAPCALSIALIWNERQILMDQAVLHGEEAARSHRAATPDDMANWLRAYVEASFQVGSQAERDRRRSELRTRIPADILWLFRNSAQSTRGPFEGYVSTAFENLLNRVEPAYRRLALALVDAMPPPPEAPLSVSDIRRLPFFDPGAMRLETIR